MILSSNAVYGFAGAYSIGVIGVADTVTAMRNCSQPPAVLPGKLVAVSVGEGIADLIIGDGLAVKAGQQAFPARVRVAVGVRYRAVYLHAGSELLFKAKFPIDALNKTINEFKPANISKK